MSEMKPITIERTADEIKILVEQAKKGDPEAFGALYTQYLTPIYRFIYFRVKNKEETEDLAQQVFLKAWNAIDRYEQQGYAFSAWLYVIARNSITDHWKKKKAVLVDEPETTFEHIKSDDDIEGDLIRSQSREHLLRAMTKLSDEQQTILTLKFINELTNTEIEVITGKRQDAIRALQYRALKALKHILENEPLE